MKRVVSFVVFLCLGLGGFGLYYAHYLLTKTGLSAPRNISIFVEPGSNLKATAEILVGAGVLESVEPFSGWARITGQDRSIKSGQYVFTLPLTPISVLSELSKGQFPHVAITIPEGKTFRDIALTLEAQGIGSKEQILALGTNETFLSRWNLSELGPEGYLYPDTYFVTHQSSPDSFIRRMLDRSGHIFTVAMELQAEKMGFTKHEILTIASLIEKEAAVSNERSLIASVFLNRLHRNMPLQCDPTVVYGIDDFDGPITRAHLRTPTPYNTYLFTGLPPGPIANPGLASIKASLNPAKTDYLYFVARGDGTHIFSSRLVDHNRAVRQYRKLKAQNG